MAGMRMTKAMNFIKRKLDSTVSRTVTIIAGHNSLEDIDAVPVTANFADYASGEYVVNAQRFDWIVKADELRFAGQKLAPQPGWQIKVELDDGRMAWYSVFSDQGSRCYDVEDQLGILYVLHTKLERVETGSA